VALINISAATDIVCKWYSSSDLVQLIFTVQIINMYIPWLQISHSLFTFFENSALHLAPVLELTDTEQF